MRVWNSLPHEELLFAGINILCRPRPYFPSWVWKQQRNTVELKKRCDIEYLSFTFSFTFITLQISSILELCFYCSLTGLFLVESGTMIGTGYFACAWTPRWHQIVLDVIPLGKGLWSTFEVQRYFFEHPCEEWEGVAETN